MSWTDQVEAVNPPVYEDRADYPPRIWWYNGVKQARTPGVFFTKLDEHPVDTLPAPWTVEHEFRGPFTVERAPMAAIVKDADGEVVGHLVDVPICPAFDFGTAVFRVVNDEADKMAKALVALWEIGNTIIELQDAEANLPDDQKNPALQRVAAQWAEQALPLVQDDLAFDITEAGEQIVRALLDGGEIPGADAGQAAG